jgi:folate-binding protein YgfZ
VTSLVALPERAVLVVSGPQRSKFLHNLLSNDVEGRAAGQGSLAGLMDARGHLLVLLRVLVGGSEILLELPRAQLAAIEALLVHYKVGAPVRFAVRPVAIRALLGSEVDALLQAVGAPVPGTGPQSHLTGTIAGQPVLVARASDLPSGAVVIHSTPEAAGAVDTALRAAGAVDMDRSAFDSLRVEQGRPLYGIDVTEDNLLHETGLVAEYHSPSKGCYVGQEVIARLEARGGNVNKTLRGLKLAAPAAAGTSLTVDGKDVGRITTAAVSEALGPIAMAYVHRNHAAPGAVVAVDGQPATVATLPMREP